MIGEFLSSILTFGIFSFLTYALFDGLIYFTRAINKRR